MLRKEVTSLLIWSAATQDFHCDSNTLMRTSLKMKVEMLGSRNSTAQNEAAAKTKCLRVIDDNPASKISLLSVVPASGRASVLISDNLLPQYPQHHHLTQMQIKT